MKLLSKYGNKLYLVAFTALGILGLALLLWGQTVVSYSYQSPQTIFNSVTAGSGLKIVGLGAAFHQLTWNNQGTVSTCQIQVDSSADGSTWNSGDVIGTTTCTSNNTVLSTSKVVNYIRINVTTWTGTGTTTATLTGYANNPSGGGGSGTVSSCAAAGNAYYSGSGTTVSCDTNIVDDGSGHFTIAAGSTSTSSLVVGSGGPGLFQVAASQLGIQTSSNGGGFRIYNGTTALGGILGISANPDFSIQTGPNPSKVVLAGNVSTSTSAPVVLLGNGSTFGSLTFTGTSGNQQGVNFGNGATGGVGNLVFNPTSGSASFTAVSVLPQINQTGGANGAYTALLINTTETSVGGTGRLLDTQVGGSTKFAINNKGNIFTAGTNSVASTIATSSSTTVTVTFTNAFTSTPVCTLTPQTTGLTSWYVSAISNTAFTITVSPSGTYTFAYHCMGNPN